MTDDPGHRGTHPIRCGGYRYHYRYFPAGQHEYDPVLFLGGAFQTMRSLQKFAEVFTNRTSVILTDLPGTGESDPLPPWIGVNFLADCVREVLDHLKVPTVNLVGVSFGTAIAYTAAQRFPERIGNLVLIGAMSDVDERIGRALELSLKALASKDMEQFSDRVAHMLLNHRKRDEIVNFGRGDRLLRAALARMSEREIEQFRVNSQRLLLHRRLDTSRPVLCRTLVLTGEHDSVTTPQHCLEVAETAREAYLALVGEADHLVPLERFGVCERLVDRFMRRAELRDTPGCAFFRPVGSLNRSEAPTRLAGIGARG